MMHHIRDRLRLFLGGVLLAAALALIFTVAAVVDAVRAGREIAVVIVLRDFAIGFGSWALLAPPLFKATSRPGFLDAPARRKAVLLLLYFALTFAAILLYVVFIAAPLWGYEPLAFLKQQVLMQWMPDLLVFTVIALAGYLTAAVQRARETELAALTLERQLVEQKADLAARETEYLRGRLGSHFVMNALANLVGLMRRGETEKAEDATILLSEILRGISSGGGAELVPLDEEIAFSRKYLAFQSVRYPTLEVRFEISPAAKSALVPRQLLQPLLENVFKHAELPDVPRLTVAAAPLADGGLTLTIANESGASQADTAAMGEGLNLTILRLQALFGKDFRLGRRYEDGWYFVTIDLPAPGDAP